MTATVLLHMQGLNCMHPKGLYHRDLKPLNIVVSGWSGGKLVDWASGRSMHQRGKLAIPWYQLTNPVPVLWLLSLCLNVIVPHSWPYAVQVERLSWILPCVLHDCMMCLASTSRVLRERASVTAAGRVNEMYSPAYASPEIIAQMHGFCKVMTDQPNDLWALGITLHQVFKPQLADCFWVCSCRGSHVY